MRITGGELGGRHVKVPSAQVRPTQDAVREALFSMLMHVTEGAVFLDLFAGSGAVGIDAWSRGAKQVTWVEKDPKVVRVLRDNVETLCGSGSATLDASSGIVHADVLTWLARPSSVAPGSVTIAYADPPYATGEKSDHMSEVLALFAASGLAAPGAIFVAEQRTGTPYPDVPSGWERIRERRYGHTRVILFRVPENPDSATRRP